ncbi:hypothetical protein KPL70_011275 [Citrus sinensis]|uniref:non-specific serine/threonine protein kinase n=1 Tax=Citrus clementina TaxID=85681 RepID=V4SPM3_CITCL|nr:hypothetical protein CICLE_v10033352mg [Citrus x clementina]KAH9703932.1 hypothetical protein KPL70_011275 [Citrus sinensis]
MITELGYEQKQVDVHCDSQSAICLSKNQVHHEKTKHIDIKLHFVRLEVSKGVVKLMKIQIDDNIADILTKAIPIAKLDLSSLLIALDVSVNKVTGSLHIEVRKLKNLEILDVSRNMLEGEIPSTLGSCTSLEILGMQRNLFCVLRVMDFSQNNLSGEILKFLTRLFLDNLNLSYNNLEGMVPTGVYKNASATSVTGNSKLCGGISKFKLPKCGSKKSNGKRLPVALNLVISIVSGLVGLALALSICFFFGFSHLRHQGAFKIFKSFIAECKALRNIRHRNLIKVLTACLGVDYQGNDFKALVYEFIHNRSPEKWLYPISKEDETYERPRNLNLLRRLNIAIDVASALNYLHHDCQPVTAHCDLKPSNVLLDDDMTARVGDFGLARFLPPTRTQTSSIDYGVGNEVSTIGDVYSYGILLLELMIREKPSDIMFEGDMNLHKFAKMALPNHVKDIVDSILLNDDEKLVVRGDQKQTQAKINVIIECVISMVRIGVACSMESPQDRMKMTNVVHELQSIKNTLLGPKNLATCKEGNRTVK